MKYKVWVEIEAIEEESDLYECASAFPVCLGEFETLKDADTLIIELTGQSSL